MKKKGLVLIIVAIGVFGLNFMTLWNQTVTTNHTLNVLGMIIGQFICPLVLLIGIILLIVGLVKKDWVEP